MPWPFPSSKSRSDSMSADPQIRQLENVMANEAKGDQKTLEHAIKDLANADKSHSKSIGAADKAHHTLDNAIKEEYSAATSLNRANHAHESAISNQQAAEKALNLKQQHESRLLQDLEQRRANVESLTQRKATNDEQRETKLSQLHARAATRVGNLNIGTQEAQPGGPEAATEGGYTQRGVPSAGAGAGA